MNNIPENNKDIKPINYEYKLSVYKVILDIISTTLELDILQDICSKTRKQKKQCYEDIEKNLYIEEIELIKKCISVLNKTEAMAIKKINEITSSKGTVKTPKLIINTQLEPKEEDPILDFYETGENDRLKISPETRCILLERSSTLILDAIIKYIQYHNEQITIQKQPTTDFKINMIQEIKKIKTDNTESIDYEINDTFADFCKMGKIEGEDRIIVKQAILDNKLSKIRLYNSKKKTYAEFEFITLLAKGTLKKQGSLVPGAKQKNIGPNQLINIPDMNSLNPETIDRINIKINGEIYEHYWKSRQAKLEMGGFLITPKNITMKITNAANTVCMLKGIPNYRKTTIENLQKAYTYIGKRWDIGKENRTNQLKITLRLLEKEKIIPTLKKSKEYRKHWLESLFQSCQFVWHYKEGFYKCKHIELIDDTIIFTPDLPKAP